MKATYPLEYELVCPICVVLLEVEYRAVELASAGDGWIYDDPGLSRIRILSASGIENDGEGQGFVVKGTSSV
jgi:hypothetical protein